MEGSILRHLGFFERPTTAFPPQNAVVVVVVHCNLVIVQNGLEVSAIELVLGSASFDGTHATRAVWGKCLPR